jgi:hypothetical protein
LHHEACWSRPYLARHFFWELESVMFGSEWDSKEDTSQGEEEYKSYR